MSHRHLHYAFHSAVTLFQNKYPPSQQLSPQSACKRRRASNPSDQDNPHGTCTTRSARVRMSAELPQDALSDSAHTEKEHAAVRKEHAQLDGMPPLSPTPAEISGFDGWREQDDAYWRDVRERELSFRASTTSVPEDFEQPPQPLDRYGNPTTYAAAAKYCHELKQWVPTTEEEEEALRRPNPVKDPFYIREAAEGERYTIMRENNLPKEGGESEEETVYMEGGLEVSSSSVHDLSLHRRKRLDMEPGGWRLVHLGTSSAVPTVRRNVSSTALVINSFRVKSPEPSMFLVDAGENTDHRLVQCDWCMTHGFRWIRAIFITHLHGDHIYGLPMLLASIGEYTQYRRRQALENGDDGSDPVIRVFGPYGTRGFVRTSLYWTNPVGVRFSIAELVPRDTDFLHLHGSPAGSGKEYIFDRDTGDISPVSDIDLVRDSPPPHPEEVRTDDVHVGEDGVWHVWDEVEDGVRVEVVAAPLKHRVACFGYVFRESVLSNGYADGGKGQSAEESGVRIDSAKAKALGVYGTQYRVLRSGRAVTVGKTGVVVRPEDVAQNGSGGEDRMEGEEENKEKKIFRRKVTVLGDTCDSSAIAEAAMDSDLLVHEATFAEDLKDKAKVAMHSTARMAGKFARRIRARKMALTHFSSRYEYWQQLYAEREQGKRNGKNGFNGVDGMSNGDIGLEENDDLANPNQLVREAQKGYGNEEVDIVAAVDFMAHDVVVGEVNCGKEGVVSAGDFKKRELFGSGFGKNGRSEDVG